MDWNVVPALHSFPRFAADWQRLNGQYHCGHPLLDARFVQTLLQHFGKANTYLAIGGHRDEPKALLLVEPWRLGIWRTFVPSQCQIAPMQLGEAGATSLSGLLGALPGRALALQLLCQDPQYSAALRVAQNAPLWDVQPHAVTMSVRIGGDWPRYWRTRSRSLRKNVRNSLNRTRAEGLSLDMSIAGEPDQIVPAIHRYGELESAGWKNALGTALHPSNVQGRFFEDLMVAFAQSGDATVYEMHHQSRLVSSRLLLRNQSMSVILKTTFDEAYARYAVGRTLLLNLLMHSAGTDPDRVIEFYTNASPEQLAWSTEQRTIMHATYYRTSVDRLAIELIRRGKTLLRGTTQTGKRSEVGQPR